jgi:hypothetical protein
MSGKYALIIGNTEYTDPGLAQLSAPGKDAEDFARVLRDRDIGAFDEVNILLNQSEPIIREAIDDFFNQKKPDDLLILYFSGHGVRDELGALYLAVKNTNRSKLRSTAVKSDYIREAMDQSRSKRQVLILDCCNSGAFAQGTKAATGASIGIASAFESGYGRVILTASDSTQFAWEGDKVIGETDNSLFTHFLVKGLDGEADLDGDGRITVDELYDYAYEKVRFATPKQTPSKFSTKQQGEIILRQSTRIQDIRPVPLPEDLVAATENTLPYVREGAIRQLDDLLKGKHLGLARSAREALERIANHDDSRRIAQLAAQILASVSQTDLEQKMKEEKGGIEQTGQLVAQNTKEGGIVRKKVKAERKAKDGLEKRLTATPISVQQPDKKTSSQNSTRQSVAGEKPSQGISRKLVMRILGVILIVLITSLGLWAGNLIMDGRHVPSQTPTSTVTITPSRTIAPTLFISKTNTPTITASLTQTPTVTSTPTNTPIPLPTLRPTKKAISTKVPQPCLSIHTTIDTPRGPVAVEDLRVGDLVWTVDASGARVPAAILKINKSFVPVSHQMAHVVLSDGRELWASPAHPTADGRTLGMLQQGDLLDGALVTQVELVIYGQPATYDILPAGATSFYWADGILMGSTLTIK